MSNRRSRRKRKKAKNQQEHPTLFEAHPDEYEKTKETQNGQTENASDEDTVKPMLQRIFNAVFRGKAPAWTAIFTAALMVFSGLLWKVSSDANDTSIQTQRAFLSYSGLQLAKDTTGEADKILKGIRVYIVWINSGTTPTKTAVAEANVAVVPDTARGANFDNLPHAGQQLIVIGPKAGTQSIPVDIPLADLESLKEGTKHAFAWGWTAYYDIFPGTPMRLSEYCTQIDRPIWTKKDHTDGTGEIRFDTPPCPVHNCYDENCSDYHAKAQQFGAFLHGQ